MEKVYVAIGSDVQEGLATLEWTLRKWSSSRISIVILHASINRDFVYTYYGKLPASYVNDESVDLLNKYQQGKLNKILQQYVDFCGEVRTETLNIEKYDEPIHRRVIQLISGLRISKLVIGATFFKSSRKSGSLMTGLQKIMQKKPDFCELYLISGGRLFVLKEENNEGFIEDDQGVVIARLNKKRSNLKGWIGKMIPENAKRDSTSSSSSADSPSIWERSAEEIEEYFNQLLNSNTDEEEESEIAQGSNANWEDIHIPQDLNPRQKTGFLRVKIGEARETIHSKRKEAKESALRYSKAEWAIKLCTSRAEDLEARLHEETMKREDLEKELEIIREQLTETRNGLEQNRFTLGSTLEIQRNLSSKLKSTTVTKSQSEEQLTKMIQKRGSMIQEIENLRKQKDVMKRRIEFCRDKDAIETVARLNDLNFSYKEFTADEIKIGTENFSEHFRIKCSGDFTNVYKARINQTTVAVRLYDELSEEEFGKNVKIISRVQHPHLVAMLGFCIELKCIVYEYMHGSCLRNVLFSTGRKKQALNWHARISIAAEVCSGLTFLHLVKPKPIVHGNLNLTNILLDRNNVAKLHGFRSDSSSTESDIQSDVRDFGSLLLQLLTGRKLGFIDTINEGTVMEVLDQRVGEWPLEVAMELAGIAVKCSGLFTGMTMVMKEMEDLKKKADDVAAEVGCLGIGISGGLDEDIVIPSLFYCPILQDIMRDPHVAADGFSYEFSAIETWLGMGRVTSPMTNLELEHKRLTPNHILRSLIQDWHKKRCISLT